MHEINHQNENHHTDEESNWSVNPTTELTDIRRNIESLIDEVINESEERDVLRERLAEPEGVMPVVRRVLRQVKEANLTPEAEVAFVEDQLTELRALTWPPIIENDVLAQIDGIAANANLKSLNASMLKILQWVLQIPATENERQNMASESVKLLSHELAKLHSHLMVTSSDLTAANSQRNRFNDKMLDHIEDLALLPIHDITDKEMLAQACEAIRCTIERFREDQNRSNQEIQARNRELTERLETVSRESEELRAELDQMSKKASTDALTSTLNRSGFQAEVSKMIQRKADNGALAIIDLDRFKSINDSLGHRIGDKILVLCAQLITRQFKGGALVARLGGDEFAIINQSLDKDAFESALNELRVSISEFKVHHNGTPIKLSISVGFAHLNNTDTPESIYDRADAALYQAKDFGRNRVTKAAA
ncbi:MAG: diguanylate cyclase [Gammaproteobacteria bacterium]|nr:diguanylate cyclase [Gammaproteobacteria bacterium]